MMRMLHLVVIAALVASAAYVYKIKFDSIMQVERLAKLRAEIKREHDATAALRAEWSKLDNPSRIQALAQRHLSLKPIDPTQFDDLDHLPERPPQPASISPQDPLAAMIENADSEFPTGSVSQEQTR